MPNWSAGGCPGSCSIREVWESRGWQTDTVRNMSVHGGGEPLWRLQIPKTIYEMSKARDGQLETIISFLYHPPAPAMLTDTTAKPLNATAWTRASLSSFWLWSSGILRRFHELWLKKPQWSGQIVSYLQLCHFPSAAGVTISGNPGSERVWSQNASLSPSNHLWMLLFYCFTVLAGQLVAQTSQTS